MGQKKVKIFLSYEYIFSVHYYHYHYQYHLKLYSNNFTLPIIWSQIHIMFYIHFFKHHILSKSKELIISVKYITKLKL